MIYLRSVKNFKLHRALKNIYLSSEGKDLKMGMLVTSLTPSMREEFQYYTDMEPIFRFRFMERICVEKLTKLTLYPSVKHRVFNTTELIRGNFPENLGTNLGLIKKIVVYNEKLDKSNELKKFNTFYEYNQAMEAFYTNSKDRRTPIRKSVSLFSILKYYLQDKLASPIFENHIERYLFIPVNLWVSFNNYKKSAYFKDTNPDWFSILICYLRKDPKKAFELFKGFKKVILTNHNEFMILDIAEMEADMNSSEPTLLPFHQYVINFMKLCKSSPGNIVTDEDEPVDDTGEPISSDIKVTAMTSQTKEVKDKEKLEDLAKDISQTPEEASKEDKSYREKSDKAVKIIEKTEAIVNKLGLDIDQVGSKELESIEKILKDNEILLSDIKDSDPVEKAKADAEIKRITQDIQASMTDLSPASIKRNKILAEKYKEHKLVTASGKSIDVPEILEPVAKLEPVKISEQVNLVNKELGEIKSDNLVEQYMAKYYYTHLLKMLRHFAECDPPLFMINNLEEEDVSDSMNRLYEYSCIFEDNQRRRHHMRFLLPKMYQDRYLFLNSAKKDMIYQKFPYPVTKVGPDKAQVVTNEKKTFISRYGANVTPKVTRLIKFLSDSRSGISIAKGDSSVDNEKYMLPLEFIELSSHIYIMKDSNFKIVFKIDNGLMEFAPRPKDKEFKTFLPIGIDLNSKEIYYLNLEDEMIYNKTESLNMSCVDFIISKFISPNPELLKAYKETSVGKKFVYSRATIFSNDIPLIILLSSMNKFGLVGVLKRAGIQYKISTTTPKTDKDNQAVIKFKDGFLVYDRYPFSNSLLLGGLSEISTEEYEFSEMMLRSTYEEIYDTVYNNKSLLAQAEAFNQTFMDPITKEVQERIGGPTDLEGTLLMASAILSDNNYKPESSYENVRVRGPEIILAYLYKELAKAYSSYKRSPRTNKFSFPKDAVIKELMKSQLIDEHSSANVMLELENDRRVKSQGPSGLNSDRSYTLDKRAFHPSMRGTVCLSTAVSGETGITRQLTINPNINDAMGFMNISKGAKDIDGSEILGAAELMNTFSIESADANRSMMTTGQSKHMLTVENMSEPLISTDFERVVPYLTRDYASQAKEDGIIKSIENGIMFIQYKDGRIDDIDLNTTPMKHTNAGKFHMEHHVTDLKVGSKVKKGQIVSYNPNHFKKDMLGDLVAYSGTLAKVAFVSTGSTFEDSTYITDSLAHKMATKTVIKKDVVVNRFSNIKHFAKKGDRINVGDYLLVFDSSEDEFTSQLLANKENEVDEGMEEIHFGSTPVKSKVTGIIRDIKVYYTVDFDKLTTSMRKFISTVSSGETDKVKSIQKFKNLNDANIITSPNAPTKPDSLGRVKGLKVNEGVLIEYYVEYLDIMGTGDKLTFNSAVKGTVNNVIEDKYAAFTDESYEPIEAFVSTIGINKRMVLDIFKIGIGNKILIEAKKEFTKLFGDEIRNFKDKK